MGVLEDLDDLRHHVDQQRADHAQRHHEDDGRVDERQGEARSELLALLEVVGQAREHARQLARGLARGDQRAVELREHARERAERLRDGVAREDLAAQRRQHLALALVLGLLDQRVERLLDGEPGLEQRGELARELRELRGRKRNGAKARAARRIVGGDDLDAVRREALVAQQRARLARAVGLEHAPVELALHVVRLVPEAGHGETRSS